MNNGFHHTEEAIKQRGEVFTPDGLVSDMLDKLPVEVFKDPTKTFLDNSCGNGQFLFAVMQRKLKQHGVSHKTVLKTIYGIELDETNAENCRKRLLDGRNDKTLRAIVDHNIITADALDSKHKGWKDVGYMWEKSEAIEKLDDEISWAQQLVENLIAVRKAASKKSGSWIQQALEKRRQRHA